MHYVYILKCADNTLYTGYTKDVKRRVYEHNNSNIKGAKYTRYRRPLVLIYKEEFESLSDALKRENKIKKMNRADKLKLINAYNLAK